MNKLQKEEAKSQRLARYAKIRTSIDFAMNFMQSYLDVYVKPENATEVEDIYVETIKETIVDLDSARQLYSYLIGDKK